jgi:hypothetical protein
LRNGADCHVTHFGIIVASGLQQDREGIGCTEESGGPSRLESNLRLFAFQLQQDRW